MEDNNNIDTPPKGKKKLLIMLLILGVLIISIPIGLQIAANWFAEKKLHALVTEAGLKDQVSWSKVKYNLIAKRLDISKFSIQIAPDSTITADKISIPVFKNGSPFPKQLTINITDLYVPVTEAIFRRYADPLLRMNYVDFRGSMTLSLGVTEDKVLEIELSNATFVNFGTLNAKLKLSDINESTIRSLVSNIKNKPVQEAWVSFLDDGVTNKMINLFAYDTGTSFDVAKARILNGLNRRMQTQYKVDSEARRSLAQIYRHIDNPHEISMQMITTGGLILNDLTPPLSTKGWRNMTTWFSGLPHKITAN